MRTWILGLVLMSCDGEGPGPVQEDLTWYTTCGDPACSGYSGPFEDVALCTTQVVGDPCSAEAELCDPQDACNARLVCATEDPKQGEGGCPISLRAYKHDIHYLDVAEVDGLRRSAVDLPLATWRYNGASEASAPRLGFIIDDRPGLPAVSLDGKHVDVYGLATMAIAAVQAQEREIAALKAKIAELEARR